MACKWSWYADLWVRILLSTGWNRRKVGDGTR
jgi:hypothetical protein